MSTEQAPEVEALAALWGRRPERAGYACDESVERRGSWRHYSPCGREAVNLLISVDYSTEYRYCRLHTTVNLRNGSYRLVRPLTEADHEQAADEREAAWLAHGENLRESLYAAGWQLTRVGDEERLRGAFDDLRLIEPNDPDHPGPYYDGWHAALDAVDAVFALAPQPPSPAACPTCGATDAHTYIGGEDYPDHRWQPPSPASQK